MPLEFIMIKSDRLFKIRSEINAASKSFCLAKWTQVTLGPSA